MSITVSGPQRWKPRRPRKQLETGRKVPVNLELERRIENGRRMGLDAKHKRGERQHARVTTPEFRKGYDGIDWSK